MSKGAKIAIIVVIGLIVGSGFARFAVASHRERVVDTEFGTPSSPVRRDTPSSASLLSYPSRREQSRPNTSGCVRPLIRKRSRYVDSNKSYLSFYKSKTRNRLL